MGDYITGTDIAATLGIHQTTWGRWVAAGQAPQPVARVGMAKLYDELEVLDWCDSLNRLVMGEHDDDAAA